MWVCGITNTGWWFGTFFIFPYLGNKNPNWLSYFSEGLKPPTRIKCNGILSGWMVPIDDFLCVDMCRETMVTARWSPEQHWHVGVSALTINGKVVKVSWRGCTWTRVATYSVWHMTFRVLCSLPWYLTQPQVRQLKPALYLCLFVPVLYRAKKGLGGVSSFSFWRAGEYDTNFRSPLTTADPAGHGGHGALRFVSRCHCGKCQLQSDFSDTTGLRPIRCWLRGLWPLGLSENGDGHWKMSD
jgi:hypothetical protein